MDSDTALRFELTANQYIAADEGEAPEEAADAEGDERGADDEDEEEEEREGEAE